MAKKRQHNDGLRKVCGCPRRGWAKCPHPWHLNFQHEGQHYRLSLDRVLSPRKVRDKTTAKKEADAIRVAIREGRFGKAEPASAAVTLKGLVALYLQRYVRVRLATNTQMSCTSLLEGIVATAITRGDQTLTLGELPAAAVAAGDLEDAIAVRLEAGGKGRKAGGKVSANRTLGYLRACYNWAIRQGYLTATPFARHGQRTMSRFKETPRHRRLAEGEEARLLGEARAHLHALIIAALDTGCRQGELLSMQWAQVSLRRNEIHLPASKTKARRERYIPLTQRLRAVLEMRRTDPEGDVLPADAYVFGNEVGERVTTVKTAWTATCRRAGITGLTFHDLRREAGSRLLEGSSPLPQQYVRDLLGHTNIATTSRYLATDRHGLQRAFRQHDAAKGDGSASLQDIASEDGSGVPTVTLESETPTTNPH